MILRLLALASLLSGALGLEYISDTSSPFHVPLRARRQVALSVTTAPSDPIADLDLQTPLNETEEMQSGKYVIDEVDHVYYTVRYHPPEEANFNRFWLNASQLAEEHPKTSKKAHPQLTNSYRRAVSMQMTFDFPFYGHPLRNLTIATGGFCYVGDQMHSWLAATQYVAPLMSNFDTTPEESNIIYADTGSLMVVEWKDVVLRNQPQAGNFSFQVSLHANGSIWFVYQKVPLNVTLISDTHHPRKIGLSDAYLYEHKVQLDTPIPRTPILTTLLTNERGGVPAVGKRVIYEYHRVEIEEGKIATHGVVEIVPNPVCIELKSCEACMNATLEKFNCSWCAPKDSKPFCSDQDGLNRRRQDWNRGSCRHQTSMTYCTDTTLAPSTTKATTPKPPVSPPLSPPQCKDGSGVGAGTTRAGVDPRGRTGAPSEAEAATGAVSSGGLSVVSILIILVVVVVVGGWLLYAYFNPHTPSGQLLIKYRPGKWRWPGAHGDVRYTASVHM